MMTNMPPFLLFFIAALITPLLTGKAKNIFICLIPALGFYLISQLDHGVSYQFHFYGYDLTLLRVDKLSKIFGYIFTLNAFAAFLYAFYLKDSRQHVSALFYIGAALGVVFCGDLVTLYFFWEVMAVASTFLILSRQTKKASGAGFRYVLIHLLGGLILLAGIVLYIQDTGSVTFDILASSNSSLTLATILILSGMLINAAAPPLHGWLPDSYPEATVTGGVILSAYTTKTSVYTLIRGFPGCEVLIIVGCVMSLYGIIYALLENDMRRILAYSIINQVGFMVCGVGIGTAMALNGAAAHAFCHIIYKALLWMSAGSVLYMTGKSKCTELGGLYKTMPLTMIFGTIGALAISSVPFTSGFTSKPLIMLAAENQHLIIPWLILEIASAGVFLHAGIKFPYFVFFAKDKGLRPGEPENKTMLWAMGFLAFLCIFLGVYPQPLYAILPFEMEFGTMYKATKVISQFQLLMFSALVFFLCLKLLKRTDTIALDTDWFYRKGARLFYLTMDKGLNGLNRLCDALFVQGLAGWVMRFFSNAPQRLALAAMAPFWLLTGQTGDKFQAKKQRLYSALETATTPVGICAAVAALMVFGLILFTLLLRK
ncbi:MAG: Na(+)/H(+) antiporter subunit D [Desulfovibrio sp.]|nr:MAG: Na(+)/H(+) antiporter subunit D [Desulfovibrio sp.]